MGLFCTLRNIITVILFALIITACSSSGTSTYYNSNLKTISSEDKYTAFTSVGEMRDVESGQTIYVVSKK